MINIENDINSQEILNAIDLGKINLTDKKKRGRPKKSQQIINPSSNKVKMNNATFEQDEIILHLPISSSDIKSQKNTNSFDMEEENESEDSEEEIKPKEVKIKEVKKEEIWNDISHKQYNQVIKKLKEENDKLKKYLIDITPMYFTEVKIYPVDLKLFDLKGNQYIPKKTNIPCFWCTYNFDWLPVCGAEKYHDGIFYVTGNFCSFNCWAADNLKRDDNNVWERYTLMKLMYYMINKDSISSITDVEINPSGPKELLEKYGGPMTIEDYRKNSKILGREYHKLMPPFMPMTIGFEESTNSKTSSKTMNINSILNAAAKDNVVVKRNKPLTNIASKEIDDFIE
jgi:hypothetical protein